jgi:hypothetical protein
MVHIKSTIEKVHSVVDFLISVLPEDDLMMPKHRMYMYFNDIFSELNTDFFFLWRYSPNFVLGLPPWNSTFHFGFTSVLIDLRHSVGLFVRVISSSQGLSTCTQIQKTHTYTQTPNIHALSGIRTHDPGFRASENSACLRPLDYRDWLNVDKCNLNVY